MFLWGRVQVTDEQSQTVQAGVSVPLHMMFMRYGWSLGWGRGGGQSPESVPILQRMNSKVFKKSKFGLIISLGRYIYQCRRMCACLVASVMSNSLQCYGLWPTRLLCPWESPGENTGVGCHALLRGIFLTQGLNPCLLHHRRILYCWATGETQRRRIW